MLSHVSSVKVLEFHLPQQEHKLQGGLVYKQRLQIPEVAVLYVSLCKFLKVC